MPLGLITPPPIPKTLFPCVNRVRAGYPESVASYGGLISDPVVGGGGAQDVLDISGSGVFNVLNITHPEDPGVNTVTIVIDGVTVFSDTGYLAENRTVNFVGSCGISDGGSYCAYDYLPFNSQFKLTVTIANVETSYVGYRYYLT